MTNQLRYAPTVTAIDVLEASSAARCIYTAPFRQVWGPWNQNENRGKREGSGSRRRKSSLGARLLLRRAPSLYVPPRCRFAIPSPAACRPTRNYHYLPTMNSADISAGRARGLDWPLAAERDLLPLIHARWLRSCRASSASISKRRAGATSARTYGRGWPAAIAYARRMGHDQRYAVARIRLRRRISPLVVAILSTCARSPCPPSTYRGRATLLRCLLRATGKAAQSAPVHWPPPPPPRGASNTYSPFVHGRLAV